MADHEAGTLLMKARRRAGLTQRELARRASTAQSVVARIELGQTAPGLHTLRRLLRAAGFGLHSEIEPLPATGSHMLADVRRILRLTPEERLMEAAGLSRLACEARRVRP